MADVPDRGIQGMPCWVSLTARSLPQAEGFYGALLGWEFVPGPRHVGRYVRAVLDGRLAAGIGEAPAESLLPVRWTTYLCCDDADATAGLIRDCGGTVGVGPLDAESKAGRLAIASDPDGAVFGVWQPMDYPGIGTAGEPGALAWIELVTRGPSSAGRFYPAVFGHGTRAEVSGRGELTLCLAGRPVAGIRGAGHAVPDGRRGARWLVSFAVPDVDRAARQVARLGGRVLDGPYDSARGRAVTVADPQGAVFRLAGAPG